MFLVNQRRNKRYLSDSEMEKPSRSSSAGSKINRVGVLDQVTQEEISQMETVEIETTQVETINELSSGIDRNDRILSSLIVLMENNYFGSPVSNKNHDYNRRVVVWLGGGEQDNVTASTTTTTVNDRAWTATPPPEQPDDGMATNKERRVSRGSIHPGGATPHIKDAFGPRNNSRTEWPGTPMPPDTMSIPDYKSFDKSDDTIPEDTTGGLPTDDKNPDRDSLFFKDCKRRIDLVMVYEEDDIELGVLTEIETIKMEIRKQFVKSLEKEGLELELEKKQNSFDQKTYFLKIHVPWKVLTRYAEVMNLKMPIKTFKRLLRADTPPSSGSLIRRNGVHPEGEEKSNEPEPYTFPFAKLFDLNPNVIAEEPSFYTATFSRDREEQFVVKDRETFFTSAQRSQIAFQILLRTKYDEEKKVGIRRLLNNGTYLSVFPLHEGDYERDAANGLVFDRRLLYLEWARPGRWYKKQPLWLVRKYFGDKIALYFAWLGFYTEMLIPPAIVGLLCFLYGLTTMDSSDNIPSKEICDANGPGNITLCPLCDKVCSYQKLVDSCVFSKITYLFDNPATVFFAIFMSFWATTFLELWKRRQAVIAWEWDLQYTEEDEEPRPEFEATVKTFRTNPVTRQKEPYMPAGQKAWRMVVTSATVLFMIMVVLSAVLGTIVYRLSVVTYIYEGGNSFVKRHAKIFTSITGATLNLIIIMILTKCYHSIAVWLTNQENPRTQIEYEDSYTFKIYFFEFMNFYSSLIYIAFFKGRFFSYPGDSDSRSSEFLRIKGDVCDPAGCLFELCIQLAIIMVGKQFFYNFVELGYPAVLNWWRKRSHRSITKDRSREYTRWEKDYQLQDPGRLALFEEYLEMVLQYGFVTLFVAAFPLAPLFALLNNIWEIRLDAFKMVAQSRRPLAERVEDIGAWYGILQGVTYCAVVSNAFVIAYTSDYIPRMVYKLVYSPTNDLAGYIDSSLSVFNTSHYLDNMGADKDSDDEWEPDTCQYRGYRNGPDHPNDAYGLSPQYWHVFAARLAFVVVFEHIVFALTGIMAYAIPDVPSEIRTQIQRERLLSKEAKFENHLTRNDKEEDEYDQMLTALRDSHNTSRLSDVIRRGSWGRRLSKQSDETSNTEITTDQQPTRHKTINTSTVWEVP